MKFIKNLSLVAIAMFLFSSAAMAQASAAQLEEISPIRAKLMVRNDGALMVDVREVDEVAAKAYDVENIINVPLSQLNDRMSEIPKDKKVIMACRSGHRSGKATKILMSHGYTNVVNMEGGIIGWESKGLPVTTGGSASGKKSCSKKGRSCCSKKGGKKGCCSKKGKGSCSKKCSKKSL